MSVIIPSSNFDFSRIKLGNPSGIQGGAYFSKITVNDETMLIQTPTSTTKNGISVTDKKNYIDFMFNQEQTDLSDWIDQLERRVKELIFQRRDAWFTSDMTMDDVDYFFTPVIRSYKSKFYLLRAFEQKSKMFKTQKKYNFGIFGENGEEMYDADLSNENTQCMSILEICGLKFTSNSFRIEVAISQLMIIKEKNLTEHCLIKPKSINVNEQETKIEENNEPASIINNEDKGFKEEINQPTKIVIKDEDDIKEVTELQIVDDVYPSTIQEVNIVIPSGITDDDEPISLKQPNEVYQEIYREARKKAKIAKNLAIKAFLEAKKIKNTYLMDELDSDMSSSSEFDDEDNIFETI